MASDDWDSVIDDVFGGGEEVQPVAKPGAQAGLYGASVEPVRGESVELARELNLPVGTVERNFDELSKLAKRRRIDYSKLATDAPLTNDWLADPVNASVAGDDIDNLIGIEQAWDYLKKGASALGSGLPKFNEGMYGLGQAVTDTARTYVTEPLSKPMDLGLFDLQVLPEDPLAPVSDFFSELRQGQKGLAERMMPKGEGSVEQGVYSGLQSLGQNLLTLPAAIMSGNPGVALAPMIGTVAGSEYGNARDKGLPYSTAAMYATSQAIVERYTEMMPMGKLIDDVAKNTGFGRILFDQLKAEMPREQVATLLQDFNEWAFLNPDKSFKSFVDSYANLDTRVSAAIQTAVATAVGVGGSVSLAKGIDAAARRFDSRVAKAAKASETRKALGQLNSFVSQAKVKQTSPSTMQAFADHVAQGGSLYVDARQLANALQQSGIDLNQVAADIPSIGEQLQAKAAAGQHIKIPASEFLTKVAGSNYAQVMLDHLKTDPNEWSQAEADEVLKGNTDAAKAEVERIIRVKRDIDAHEASAEVVRKGFEDQLNTANRFSKDVNKAYAQMLGSFYSVTAARIGMTPEEMAAKYPLLISAEQTGGERVLNQFAGVRAATADTYAMETAQSRIAKGESPERVRRETGWFKGVDGEWRFEISDDEAKFIDTDAIKGGNDFALSEVLDHPKLFAAYPEMKRMRVRFVEGTDYRGAYSRLSNSIDVRVGESNEELLSTLLHEIQHAIQEKEGFAKGGNDGADFTKSVKQALNKIDQMERERIEAWKWNNREKLDAAETASQIARFGLMWESAQRLIDYSNRDKPSGVFRLIRNETQWIYAEEFRDNEDAKELQRAFYGIPKSGAKRNQRIGDIAFRTARILLDTIPPELREQFKNDERTMKGMINALRRESEKKRKELAPLRRIENTARNASELRQAHEYSSSYEIYRSLAGEVEARNTQARQKMTDEERRDTSPTMTADVKPEATIVMFGGMDVRAPTAFSKQQPNKLPDTIDIDGVQRPTVNSNGKPIAQTEEGIRNFWRWFGDSKVVDEQGRPLVVYHGTKAQFEVFDFGRIGQQGRAEGAGFYFTTNRQVASGYGEPMEVYLSVQKPLAYDAKGFKQPTLKKIIKRIAELEAKAEGSEIGDGFLSNFGDVYSDGLAKVVNDAARMIADDETAIDQLSGIVGSGVNPEHVNRAAIEVSGFDGVAANGFANSGDTQNRIFVAFTPEQIKSAVGNSGAFDPQNPNILNQAAYHGSPFKFDKFTLDHIGNGEGAQAYGWGLYFAGNKEVAEWYRTKLTGYSKDLVVYNGQEFHGNSRNDMMSFAIAVQDAEGLSDNARDALAVLAMKHRGDMFAVSDDIGVRLITEENEPDPPAYIEELYSWISATDEQFNPPEGGQLYKVDIPDSGYILWDKSLSKQPDNIKTALRSVVDSRLGAGTFDAFARDGNDYRDLKDNLLDGMSEEEISRALSAEGVSGVKYLDGNSRGGGGAKENYNYVVFDDQAIQVLDTFYQDEQSNQRPLAEISFANDITSTPTVITLLKGANLSSFIHESGHFFLEVLADISSRPNAPLLLQEDFKTVMDWFGVTREQWAGMTLEQKRPYHEQFARGFETYAWEGKAPSLALSKLFQRFRAWMLDAYKKLLDAFNNRDLGKALDVRLSDDVRAVFDRMLATQEQINEANLARGYMPAFETKEEAEAAGVDWEQYQADLEQANQDAITDLESRSLRDLRWFRNAHNKEVRRLRREAAALRREARIDARAEVMSHPIYQAMQFLTAPVDAIKAPKAKSDPNVVDPANDSLLVAVAKLGGLQRDMAVDQFGLDPADFKKTPVFGKPILRRNGGLTPDGMAEALAQLGYMPAKFGGSWDMNDLGDYLHDEGKGIPHYSETFDYRNLDEQTAGLPDLEANPFVGGRIDRESMVREYGGSTEEFPWENLGKMISNDGIHPDVIADRFGFQSGDEMVRFLMDAKPLQTAIEDTTDRIMFERHGDLTSKEALDKAADEAIHNKMRAKVLATEANALAKTLGARGITAKAARVFAERILAGMKILDIKPSHFAAEESKAAARFDKARKKGNVNDQALEKRNQLVNNIATRLAYDAEEEVAKAVRHFKQLQKPGSQKSMRGEYLEQLNALLERFELRTGGNSRKAINKANTLPVFAEWLQTKAEELGAPTPDMVAFVLDGGIKKPYRDMTLEEFRGLVDAVKQLEHLARREQKQYMEIRGMEFEQEKNAILDRLRQFHPDAFDADGKPKGQAPDFVPSLKQKLGKDANALLGEFLGNETIVNILEGGEMGLLHESLFKRISDRSNWRTTRMEGIFKKLEPLFDQYTIAEKRAFSMKDIGGAIGIPITREKALGVALLVGNAEGRERVRNYGWSDEQIIKIIDLLDERDKRLAEGIWDLFDNDLWPELKALNERTAGKAPPKVEATPYTNRLGTWKGGYMRLKYDSDLDERAYKFDVEQSLTDLRNGFGLSSKTPQGTSQERKKGVLMRPRLDFNVFVETVTETVHDIAYREAVSDVIRLLNDKEIQAAIKQAGGVEVFRAMRRRVAEVAARPHNPHGFIEKFVSIARRNTIVTLMSGVGTAFQNLTGIIPAAGRVHPWLLAREVRKFYSTDMKKSYDFAVSQSEYMRHRFTSYEQDLVNMANKLTVKGSLMPDTATFLALMGWIDRGVAVPVWNAAFAEGMEKHANDQALAVEYADHVVRQTQGSGRIVDKPGIMTGHPLKTIFTMFHSYFNGQLQQLVRAGLVGAQEAKTNPRAAAGRVALAFVVFWILPALVTEMFRRTPDDEDDEEKAMRYAKGLLLYPAAMFPLVRDIAPWAWDKYVADSGWARSFRMSPVESAVEGVAKGVESTVDIAKGEGDQRDVKNLLMGVGFTFGVPGKLISDVVTGFYDFAAGDAGPEAILVGPEPKK